MILQQRVTVRPTSDGAVFINEQGERVVRTNGAVAAEIEAIIEAIPAGQEAVLLFTVEIPEEFEWLTADTPVRAEAPKLHGRNGSNPLTPIPAILEAEDYPPDESPELCAICEQEITAGQHARQDDSRPGYYYRHSDCGLPR